MLAAIFLQLGQTVEPPGASAHHGHFGAQGFEAVIESCLRRGELYCHVGGGEGRAVYVALVVDVDAAYYFVSAGQGLLLYLVAHAAVTYECYLHYINNF